MTQAVDLANAINGFVVGCKQDGIWDAIKACCIMAAWDGLNGALYPLKGTAPTPYNFVSGDYDRKTGLKGDGSIKYIDSGRDNDEDPQNNNHASVFVTEGITLPNTPQVFFGASGGTGTTARFIQNANGSLNAKANDGSALFTSIAGEGVTTGLKGVSRVNPSLYSIRTGGANYTGTQVSAAPSNTRLSVFRRTDSTQYLNARLSFYSIGEALPDGPTKTGLQLLDERVSALITAIGAAIP